MNHETLNSRLNTTAETWDKRMGGGWGIDPGEDPVPEAHTVAAMLPWCETILDLGIGNGRNTQPFLSKAGHMVGVDLSPIGLHQLGNRFPTVNAALATFHYIPLRNDSVDVVLAIQALQHNDWDWYQQCLTEIDRVLKPGGWFYIRVRSASDTPKWDASFMPDGPYGGLMHDYNAGPKGGMMARSFVEKEIWVTAEQLKAEIVWGPVEAVEPPRPPDRGGVVHLNALLRKV